MLNQLNQIYNSILKIMLEQHEMKTIHCRGLCKTLPSFPKPERVRTQRACAYVCVSFSRSLLAVHCCD